MIKQDAACPLRVQVDFPLMVRTDEEARIEWGLLIGSHVLDNNTRTEFDALVDNNTVASIFTAGQLPQRCFEALPSDDGVWCPRKLPCSHRETFCRQRVRSVAAFFFAAT
jgi:hypothetical protein